MVIDTNVDGPFLTARAAAPQMVRTAWGRIVNVSIGRASMRRPGFSPCGPPQAVLEPETIIARRICTAPGYHRTLGRSSR